MSDSKVIAYQQSNGLVAIIHPSYYSGLTLEEIAVKDVPDGCGYIVVDTQDLPTRLYRDKWQICFKTGRVILALDESI